MGNTYGFTKVDREKLFAKKFVSQGEDTGWLDDNPLYIEFESKAIADDLDREDYLSSLLKEEDGDENYDKDLTEKITKAKDEGFNPVADVNATFIVRPQVERALKALEELDAKIRKMCNPMPDPPDGQEWDCVGEAYIPIASLDKFKKEHQYVEEKPKKYDYEFKDTEHATYYFGYCKRGVEIYKEVEKVYGGRVYHYTFPWQITPERPWLLFGSLVIQRCLKRVLKEMDADKNKEFVFFLYWC